jgi:hypothetical protein
MGRLEVFKVFPDFDLHINKSNPQTLAGERWDWEIVISSCVRIQDENGVWYRKLHYSKSLYRAERTIHNEVAFEIKRFMEDSYKALVAMKVDKTAILIMSGEPIFEEDHDQRTEKERLYVSY